MVQCWWRQQGWQLGCFAFATAFFLPRHPKSEGLAGGGSLLPSPVPSAPPRQLCRVRLPPIVLPEAAFRKQIAMLSHRETTSRKRKGVRRTLIEHGVLRCRLPIANSLAPRRPKGKQPASNTLYLSKYAASPRQGFSTHVSRHVGGSCLVHRSAAGVWGTVVYPSCVWGMCAQMLCPWEFCAWVDSPPGSPPCYASASFLGLTQVQNKSSREAAANSSHAQLSLASHQPLSLHGGLWQCKLESP